MLAGCPHPYHTAVMLLKHSNCGSLNDTGGQANGGQTTVLLETTVLRGPSPGTNSQVFLTGLGAVQFTNYTDPFSLQW